MPSEEYKTNVSAFETTLKECFSLSQQCAGMSAPTSAHFYASVLFTTLCSRSASFVILAPGTSFSIKAFDHWDYASLAVMARSILEIRIAFFYIGVQECTPAEWNCRWNLFNLHDCMSRIHLFEKIDPLSKDLLGFKTQADEIQDRLKKNEFFLSLSESEQRRLLHGQHAYPVPLEKIAEQAGVELTTFRLLYKFLSSHVHGLPISFYSAGDDGRGRGVHCEVEENYSSLCVSFVHALLVASRDEMRKLFEPHIIG
ncbi:MAG: DUF5677 domain-containing protein [Nitrospira sp.]|nr:DUF5677 domain-containing protein [Nitrospira sp.]